ncbi:MAG: PKD domain-containing protein, partial [Ilumatobacteraceae bacterium]
MGAAHGRRGRFPGGGTARKVGIAALVTALLAAVGMLGAPVLGVGAQKVANPGNLNFKITDGEIKLGTQKFGLKPSDTTECNDGKNNDGEEGGASGTVQDLLVDYPADPQCSSPDDNSEVQSGFQPKQDTVISGTVTGTGAVSVPQAGIFFPVIYQYQQGAVLTVQVQPTAVGTGNINPLTGVASLSISLRINIQGSPSGVSLGSNCSVGPFTLAMISGTTNPPAPNTPITGVPYNETTGRATVVNNSFSVPGASGCGPLGLGNGPLNDALGVPAPAGSNSAVLELEGTPKVLKGVRASNVPSALSGSAPLTVNFNGTGSSVAKAPISYAWNFGNGQTATGATGSTVYTTPGTYTATLAVTDGDGDTDTQTQTITVTEPPNVLPTAAIAA